MSNDVTEATDPTAEPAGPEGAATESVDVSRLSMPLGEAMFTQRAIRRFRPDPIPIDDLHLILEAAVKAPNGGNQQRGRFLLEQAERALG